MILTIEVSPELENKLESEAMHRGISKDEFERIVLEAKLRYANQEAFCTAKVDTRSQVCLFEREFAEYLGIDVESGYRETFSTLSD